MDAVGLRRRPVRAPPRLPLDRRRARGARRRARARCAAAGRRLRAARYFAAVDSHTEGMPTRVITGGVGPIPGATMLERKLHFEAELDDLRLLLMREPRGHARDVGRDPAAADPRRTPTGACSSSRSPAACRCAGTGRSASRPCSSRPAWSRCTEPETVVRLDTPGRAWSRRACAVRGRPRATSVTLRNVPAFLHARDRDRRASTASARCAYDMAFGGNFYAIVDAAAVGLEVDPARAGELIERGRARHGRDRRRRPPGAPGGRAHRRLPPRRLPRARAATAPTRAPRPRSTPAGSTARRAAPARARGWRSCTPAASWRSATPFVNESVIGTRFTGRLVEETDGRRAARRSCPRSPAAPGSPAWASTCSTRATRSRPASRCERADVVGRRRRHRRRRDRAASCTARGVEVALLDRGEVVGRHDRARRGQRAVSDKRPGPSSSSRSPAATLRRARGALPGGAHPPQGRAPARPPERLGRAPELEPELAPGAAGASRARRPSGGARRLHPSARRAAEVRERAAVSSVERGGVTLEGGERAGVRARGARRRSVERPS